MISSGSISEIILTYKKHGWVLRRVLLSEPLERSLEEQLGELFGDTQIRASAIDAIWFSRPPSDGHIAWEIRHLSDLPYALLANFDESSEDLEDSLRQVEMKLRDAVSSKRIA
jgi:hypothetical protein